MSVKPLVSVILPTFNAERFIASGIGCVLAQSYPRLELIVVDDTSTDATASVARAFGDRVRVQVIPHVNLPTARNVGLNVSRGEFIAFTAADDLWPPEKLAVQVEHLTSNPAVMGCTGRTRLFLDEGCEWPSSLPAHLRGAEIAAPFTEVMLVRRALFECVGGFNEGFKAGDDLEWLARLSDAGIRLDMLPQVLLHRRITGGNDSLTNPHMREFMFRALRESLQRKRSMPMPASHSHLSGPQGPAGAAAPPVSTISDVNLS